MHCMKGTRSTILFIVALILIVVMTLFAAMDLLPAAPFAPTPTPPLGLELPEKLPRIPR
jgi:hypothetical protein